MTKVTFPLKLRMKGSKVEDLQAALQLLLGSGVLPFEDARASGEIAAALEAERATRTFGPATRTLVRLFQEYLHLSPTGEVDEQTTDALNSWLAKDNAVVELRRAAGFAVRGFVRFADGSPAASVKVSAFDRDLRTEQLL